MGSVQERQDGVAVTDWSGLEVLDVDTCMELVASVPIGRVAMIDRGELLVVPVNHVVHGRAIAFRSGIGAKLDAGVMRHLVSFEVDDYDAEAHTGWSVVVKGRAGLVDDEALREELAASGVRPWSNPTVRTHWVVIRPVEITGRRVLPS